MSFVAAKMQTSKQLLYASQCCTRGVVLLIAYIGHQRMKFYTVVGIHEAPRLEAVTFVLAHVGWRVANQASLWQCVRMRLCVFVSAWQALVCLPVCSSL